MYIHILIVVYINVCAYIIHLLNNGLHKPRRNKSTARSSQHWNFIVVETGHVAGYCGLSPNIWDSPAPIPCRTRRTHRFTPLKSKTDRVGCIHPHSPSFHMFHIPKKMFGQHNDLGYNCTWPRFVLVHFHEPIAVANSFQGTEDVPTGSLDGRILALLWVGREEPGAPRPNARGQPTTGMMRKLAHPLLGCSLG